MFRNTLRSTLLASLVAILCYTPTASAWTLEWDFEDGKLGNKVSGMSAAGHTVYDDTHAYSGGKSARMTAVKGQPGWGNWGGVIDHPQALGAGDEVWLRLRTWVPEDFEFYVFNTSRVKFLRIHTADATGRTSEGYNNIYLESISSKAAFSFIFGGQNRWSLIGQKADHTFKRGAWETYEVYMRFDSVPASQGGKARIRYWKDGKLLKDITDLKTLKTTQSKANRTHIFTWFNNEGSPKTQSMWVDDIILTSDRPSETDETGFPFIGMGVAGLPSAPIPPVLTIQP